MHDRAAARRDEGWQFARAWLANPLRTGAVTPSGPALARAITRELNAGTGPVVELGPGTGVFTRAMLMRGVAAADITAIEAAPRFAANLRRELPAIRVVEGDAGAPWSAAPGSVGAVVSGLPLLSMPDTVVTAILRESFTALKPGGAFYQFTYGPKVPIDGGLLEAQGLVSQKVTMVWRNVPPATVYRIRRATEL